VLKSPGPAMKNVCIRCFPSFCGGMEPNLTEAATGIFYQPKITMSVEQRVECLAGETKVLEENMPQ
jgi:hypothetical protein